MVGSKRIKFHREVPMLTQLPYILIVDPESRWGEELRLRLFNQHAPVLLASSFATAIAVAKTVPVAVAILNHEESAATNGLSRRLAKMGINILLRQDPLSRR